MVRKYDPGLVMYLPFFEGSGSIAHDVTQYGNNGTINGASWVDTGDPKLGYALSFNGESDYVEVPHDDSLVMENELTLEAYVKFNSVSGEQWFIFNNFVGNEYGIGKTDTDYLIMAVTLSDSGWTTLIGTTTKLVADVWYHIVGTYNSSDGMRIYINENLEGNLSANESLASANSNPLYIGCKDFWGVTSVLNGMISRVRIYNRTLTQAEITRLYRLGYIRYASIPSIVHSLNLKGWQ